MTAAGVWVTFSAQAAGKGWSRSCFSCASRLRVALSSVGILSKWRTAVWAKRMFHDFVSNSTPKASPETLSTLSREPHCPLGLRLRQHLPAEGHGASLRGRRVAVIGSDSEFLAQGPGANPSEQVTLCFTSFLCVGRLVRKEATLFQAVGSTWAWAEGQVPSSGCAVS